MVVRLYTEGNIYAVPLYVKPILDYHSNLEFTTIYSSDNDFVGFAFAAREEIYRWFNIKRITKSIENEILTMVNRELAIYNEYLKGATYHYVIKTADGTEIDHGLAFYELDGDTDKMLELMLKEVLFTISLFVEI